MGFLNLYFGAFGASGKEFLGKACKMFGRPELSKFFVFILLIPGAAASASACDNEQIIENSFPCIFPVFACVRLSQSPYIFCPVISRVAASAVFDAYRHVCSSPVPRLFRLLPYLLYLLIFFSRSSFVFCPYPLLYADLELFARAFGAAALCCMKIFLK